MKRVAVIMGSDSDLPVVSGCAAKLDELGINYEMRVMSAHRTPADVAEFAQNAYKRDFGVIIAAAGKAVQMPSGVPVATVAVDGAANAAILAAQMLSLAEPALHEKLDAMRIKMAEDVRKKDAALQHRD